jgi:hypothetical protein
MSRPRINVSDNTKWGLLVKTWATGKNYVDHRPTDGPFPTAIENPPKFPKPTSFKDFVQQCTKAGVTLIFEDGNERPPVGENEDMGFVLLQVTSDTSVLRLPAKEKIEESERFLANNDYLLPQFYGDLFNAPIPTNLTPQQKAVLHAQRVGEYTINTCM